MWKNENSATRLVVGQPETNRLATGVGIIPRGKVGLVFAGIGSASGILSGALDAAIILMVILTTFIAPPLLSVVFRSRVGAEAEKGYKLIHAVMRGLSR